MVSAGEREIRAVVVIGPAMEYLCTPCGDCRQRLREFSDDETRIYSLWKDGKLGAEHKMMDLLPLSFGPENLVEVGTLPRKKPKKKAAGTKTKKKAKPAAERVKNIKKKDGDKKNDSGSRKLQSRTAR